MLACCGTGLRLPAGSHEPQPFAADVDARPIEEAAPHVRHTPPLEIKAPR